MQEAGDQKIPADVQEKLLRFVRAGLAVSLMRGKSYLAMGGVSMGIAGSIVDQPLFEKYLGMRVETVDMSEILRRIDRGIYDKAEYKAATAWVKKNCKEGKDYNPPKTRRARKLLDQEWATSIKMALIARDLMAGNPALAKAGYGEEALGHNAIAAGSRDSASGRTISPMAISWRRYLTHPSTGTGARAPYMLATENLRINSAAGIAMVA